MLLWYQGILVWFAFNFVIIVSSYLMVKQVILWGS